MHGLGLNVSRRIFMKSAVPPLDLMLFFNRSIALEQNTSRTLERVYHIVDVDFATTATTKWKPGFSRTLVVTMS